MPAQKLGDKVGRRRKITGREGGGEIDMTKNGERGGRKDPLTSNPLFPTLLDEKKQSWGSGRRGGGGGGGQKLWGACHRETRNAKKGGGLNKMIHTANTVPSPEVELRRLSTGEVPGKKEHEGLPTSGSKERCCRD